jgi:hypothetical protein
LYERKEKMARVRNSKGDGFLVDGNGDFIDSDLMENDPLPMDVIKANNVPMGDTDDLIAELFPEVDLEAEKLVFNKPKMKR